jgi:hypothetical protein
MNDISMEDTAAYKIVRQVVNHTWGSDEDISEEELVIISKKFHANGGSWQRLMDGDIKSVNILEEVIDELINNRNLSKIATKIVSKVWGDRPT